jgi:hypothetical protein
MVIHKPARECPIAEPHPRADCGIVKVREQRQAEMDSLTGSRRRPG